MASKQRETIQQICVSTRWLKSGDIANKVTLFFESGLRYAETYLGLNAKFEHLKVGDMVLVIANGNSVVAVQEV